MADTASSWFWRQKLESLTEQQKKLFAYRCGLRILPITVGAEYKTQFAAWQKEDRVKHVFALHYVHAVLLHETKHSYAYVHASASASATIIAADATNAATNAAYTNAAIANIAANTGYAAAYAVRSANYIYEGIGLDIIKEMLTDIATLKDKQTLISLWHDGQPQWHKELEKRYFAGLEKIGLGQFVSAYQEWIFGRTHNFDVYVAAIEESIFETGSKAILAYIAAYTQGVTHNPEARVVLLGHGNVGKTSLVRRFFGEPIQNDEKATPRVEVRQKLQEIYQQEIQVHYWDFGGQEFLHAGHQFFLREKCIYIVMINARDAHEHGDFVGYWLEHVKVFGKGSLTIIIQNQVDELAKGMNTPMPFDFDQLQSRYPFVVDAINSSLLTDQGLTAIEAAVAKLLAQNHILQATTPTTWFKLKESLQTVLIEQKQSHIGKDTFMTLLEEAGIDAADEEGVRKAFDQLGIALTFPEADENWYILNPSWLSESIYYLLNRAEAQNTNNGILDIAILATIFAEEKAPDVPKDKFKSLLAILEHYEIAYFDEHQQVYRVPLLTNAALPNLPAAVKEASVSGVECRMHAFLPQVLFYRFIAQCGGDIDGNSIWRTGCILYKDDVYVQVDYINLTKTIELRGYGKKKETIAYVADLRRKLQKLIGANYKNLNFDIIIHTPEGHFNYQVIMNSIALGIQQVAPIDLKNAKAKFVKWFSESGYINLGLDIKINTGIGNNKSKPKPDENSDDEQQEDDD